MQQSLVALVIGDFVGRNSSCQSECSGQVAVRISRTTAAVQLLNCLLETFFQILDGSKQTCSSAHQETADAARSEESANRDLRQDGPFFKEVCLRTFMASVFVVPDIYGFRTSFLGSPSYRVMLGLIMHGTHGLSVGLRCSRA